MIDIHLGVLCGCALLSMPESREMTEQSNHHKWLASWKNKSVEKLEMLPASTAPGTPQHQWPAKERRRKGKRSEIVSGKDRKGPSSVKPTLRLFQRQCSENL